MYVSHHGCRVFDSSFRSCQEANSVLKLSEEKIVLITLHQECSCKAGCINEEILLGRVTAEVWCVYWVLSECGISCRVCVTHCRSSRTPPLWGPSSHWGSSREGRNAENAFSPGGTACSGQRPPNSHLRQISARPQREKDCDYDGCISA